MSKFLKNAVSLAALAMVALPSSALAQNSVPSYAQPNREEQIKGVVVAFDGHYDLKVRDQRGYVDNVRLHQGTVINPTGLTLQRGMSVTIFGEPSGRVFDANEIQTPYNYAPAPVAVPVYPYPYAYPYQYWG
ncbi:MAG: hypothetical protein ACREMT_04270, partial [Vulcanimicrobiaceae bacterium]